MLACSNSLSPAAIFNFRFSPTSTGDACTQWENVFGTIGALNFERIILNGDHRHRFIFYQSHVVVR